MTAAETVAAIRAALEEAGREYRARIDDILDAALAELSPTPTEVPDAAVKAAARALSSLDAIQARADAWRDAKEHSHESQHLLVVAVAAASASATDVPALVKALRDVLARHQRDEDGDCTHCNRIADGHGREEWPCDTVRAITAHIDTTPREAHHDPV